MCIGTASIYAFAIMISNTMVILATLKNANQVLAMLQQYSLAQQIDISEFTFFVTEKVGKKDYNLIVSKVFYLIPNFQDQRKCKQCFMYILKCCANN